MGKVYKLAVDRVDFGVCFHTALRKACDSDWTSLAYNLIHLRGMGEEWKLWLDLFEHQLDKRLDKKTSTIKAEELLISGGFATSALDICDAARNCLRITFGAFEDDEWLAMFSYAFELLPNLETHDEER